MRRKTFQLGILGRLIIALILGLCLVPISSNPVVAISVEDYFTIIYEPVEFSKTEIQENEVFNATIEAEASCTNDLPVPVSEAVITGRIIAEHQASGAEVTLSSSYTLTINPFPSQKDEITQVSQVVSLQFPGESQSGTYSVVGELIEAEVKTILGWISVTAFLPSSQAMGSVTYVSGSTDSSTGGSSSGRSSEDVPPPEPGTTDVSDIISSDGVFTAGTTAQSEDSNCELSIDEYTKGLTKNGEPLSEISILEMEAPPVPPENCDIIGLTYDLGPDGATFDPPITITFTYDESLIPDGVAEEDLVIVIWDETAGEWVVLADRTVDPETNTITAPVSHFTAFTILAYTCPATFTVTDLAIAPAEVDIGEEVTISILIANIGDLEGRYQVTLKIDNVVLDTKEVTVDGGASQKVTFTTAKDAAGTYAVNVNTLSGTFTVKAAPLPVPVAFTTSALTISPEEVDIGQPVTISILIANIGDLEGRYEVTLKIDNVVLDTKEVTLEGGASQKVTFTTAKDAAGTYAVNVDGLAATFVVKALINWWLIGGIIAGCLIIGVIILLVVMRRKA